MKILLKNIILPYDKSAGEALLSAKKKLRSAGITVCGEPEIYRSSIDARRKNNICRVWSAAAEIADNGKTVTEKKLASIDASELKDTEPLALSFGSEPLSAPPVVTGFGPCGMFCALLLAENGYAPVVIERGGDVAERAESVRRFFETGKLDPASNVQFGAGGAGTFSDGKLVTRINDPLCRKVLETFRRFGAPEQIMTDAHPHIGTDRLLEIVKNIDAEIRRLGGQIFYGTQLCGIRADASGRIGSVCVRRDGSEDELSCGALILAVGHSARDTFEMLERSGVTLEKKAFSVGVRIEHLQSNIDRMMYGDKAGDPLLPAAEYAFSLRRGEDAVYTFCMCPGGKVVAAASEEGGVVTNGMSDLARDGINADAALAVTVSPDDPVAFQRGLERAAFAAGGGNYAAPVETVGSFLGSGVNRIGRVSPTYTRGEYRLTRLSDILPAKVSAMLGEGIRYFGKKSPGFDDPEAVLTGVETRTSSPYRIPRGETRIAAGFDNLYPCGEGAGYAGGITSAAVDGLRTAAAVMERYRKSE